jgi:hypothetical protein
MMPSLFEAVHAFTQQDHLPDLKRKELPRAIDLGDEVYLLEVL